MSISVPSDLEKSKTGKLSAGLGGYACHLVTLRASSELITAKYLDGERQFLVGRLRRNMNHLVKIRMKTQSEIF